MTAKPLTPREMWDDFTVDYSHGEALHGISPDVAFLAGVAYGQQHRPEMPALLPRVEPGPPPVSRARCTCRKCIARNHTIADHPEDDPPERGGM